METKDLHIIAVTGPDINNGPGFRVTIWVSGCTHACPGCQNKQTNENLPTPHTQSSSALSVVSLLCDLEQVIRPLRVS